MSETSKMLWAVKIGDEDWQEQIITTDEKRIPDARKWAEQNGFNRFRVSDVPQGAPDFRKTVRI